MIQKFSVLHPQVACTKYKAVDTDKLTFWKMLMDAAVTLISDEEAAGAGVSRQEVGGCGRCAIVNDACQAILLACGVQVFSCSTSSCVICLMSDSASGALLHFWTDIVLEHHFRAT